MKLGDIYRKAAERLDRAEGLYISDVLGDMYFSPNAACKNFWAVYEPGNGFAFDGKEQRVLALLFAAAIADSEGK